MFAVFVLVRVRVRVRVCCKIDDSRLIDYGRKRRFRSSTSSVLGLLFVCGKGDFLDNAELQIRDSIDDCQRAKSCDAQQL